MLLVRISAEITYPVFEHIHANDLQQHFGMAGSASFGPEVEAFWGNLQVTKSYSQI
ncbi:hypothetical protein ACLB1Q_08685 [Escherichia coli]